jgi:hypothetical protein
VISLALRLDGDLDGRDRREAEEDEFGAGLLQFLDDGREVGLAPVHLLGGRDRAAPGADAADEGVAGGGLVVLVDHRCLAALAAEAVQHIVGQQAALNVVGDRAEPGQRPAGDHLLHHSSHEVRDAARVVQLGAGVLRRRSGVADHEQDVLVGELAAGGEPS